MKDNKAPERLQALRTLMRRDNVQAVIIPQTDAHQGEYLAAHWQVRRWLSGFTGSAGTLVVTTDKAALWVDSRYWLQGGQQIEGTGIELMKEGMPGTPDITTWLIANLKAGDTVGINGMVFSLDAEAELAQALAAKDIKLDTAFDVIDELWHDRPALPQCPAFRHDVKYAGEEAASKMRRVLDEAQRQGATSAFISDLAEVAWTLNLRSSDVPCNPVMTAFLYLAPESSTLFVDEAKIGPEVGNALKADGVAVAPYTSVKAFLEALPDGDKVLVSTYQTAATLGNALGRRKVAGKSPVAMLKAVKNDVQLHGEDQAMLRDGVAMVRSLMEIERTVEAGQALDEIGVADILLRNRKAQPMFVDVSFETIAGYGAHGAIVHYSATPESNVPVTKGNLLLIDSGAQYLDGTTDITRTISLGTPTAEQRHDFTLVMKGHIAIATVIFPEGTRGHQLDAMARLPLWLEGKSYLHGTGHGVGHFLNVHEGPQSIRLNDTLAPLMPGMITSNEPGLYLSDRYGIRCENLIVTVPRMETEFGRFYGFRTITLCPFDRALFDTSIMTAEETAWVNDYHRQVREALTPLLKPEERQWLAQATQPLS